MEGIGGSGKREDRLDWGKDARKGARELWSRYSSTTNKLFLWVHPRLPSPTSVPERVSTEVATDSPTTDYNSLVCPLYVGKESLSLWTWRGVTSGANRSRITPEGEDG